MVPADQPQPTISRAARLAGHAKNVAGKARGLEAALIDRQTIVIAALEARDTRPFSVAAAGPAALIVSKMHKIRERLAEREQRRLDDKDALAAPEEIARSCAALSSDLVSPLTQFVDASGVSSPQSAA